MYRFDPDLFFRIRAAIRCFGTPPPTGIELYSEDWWGYLEEYRVCFPDAARMQGLPVVINDEVGRGGFRLHG